MNENNTPLLSVKDLVVEYTSGKNTVHAVNGVSFTLGRGKTLGLVGETGAGKTTIAKSILRILPDPPAIVKGGEITFEGQDLLSLPEEDMLHIRGRKIAMIFQDPMTALNPVMTVGDQIMEVLKLHKVHMKKEELVNKTIEMLEMVGIPGVRMVEYPHQFSGGMKQRVVIAMALACDPQLLLADEPTTALDVTIQAQVLQLINRLKKEFDTSMLLITHDLGVVANTCDDVAVVYAGHIVEMADRRSLFKHPTHPYTKGLLDSIPKMNTEEARLTPIPGMPPDPTELPEGCVFAPRCKYATDICRKQAPDAVQLSEVHTCWCHNIEREG